MEPCRRFGLFICAGLTISALLSGCGGSNRNDTIPSTVSVLYSHSVIFRNHSTMTVGYNAFGQLGNDTLTNRSVADLVPGLGHVEGGAGGAEHTLVYVDDTVMAWGYNWFGQLGSAAVTTEGSNAFSKTPVTVTLPAQVKGVAAGTYHSLAIAGTEVWGWGYNGYGQVGNNTLTKAAVPVKVDKRYDGTDLIPATAAPVQVAAGAMHSLVLLDDGTVLAWGDNEKGQLGLDPKNALTRMLPNPVPLTPSPGGKVEFIAAAGGYSLALENVRDPVSHEITGQTLWGWGYDGAGQLGVDPKTLVTAPVKPEKAYSFEPTKLYSVTSVNAGTLLIKKVSAGLNHVLLLLGAPASDGSDGSWTVKGLGFNFYGQLGNSPNKSDNIDDNSFTLVQTLGPGTATPNPPITGVTDILAFGNQSLALVNGAWYGWGDNGFGQLGNPIATNSGGYLLIPTRVQGF